MLRRAQPMGYHQLQSYAAQEMVDKFRMLNGKSINETGSGYTETGFAAAGKTNFYVAGTSICM